MKTSKSDQTRQHIIASTAGIFNKKGFAGTSITDITKATGLTSGSIYGNFENKEEVALAAFDYNLANFRGVVAQRVNRCLTNKDKLLMYIKAYHSSENVAFPEGGCPMQNTLAEADDTHEELRKRAGAGLMLWKSDLVNLINKGIAEKEFAPETDANKIALHIIALTEFGFMMGSATKSRNHVDELLDMATEIVQKIII